MAKLGDFFLIAVSAAFLLVVGADLFGQTVLIPMTFSEPPRSLLMYHGPVEYDSAPFWRILTMLVTILSFLAVITNWTKSRKKLVLGFFIAFLILNAVSFAYVFPEFQAIQAIPYSDTVDPELVARAQAQQVKSGIRWIVALFIGLIPLYCLTKPR